MKRIMLIIILFTFVLTLSSCNYEFVFEEILVLLINDGQDTVEINTEWTDLGAKFYIDNNGFPVVGVGIVDTSELGLYEIEYLYAYEGKVFSKTRFVIVIDQTAPVITLNPGVDTIKLGESWVNTGAVVVDNSGEILQIEIEGTVNTSAIGQYEIVYSARDSSGNITMKTRYINIID